MPHSPVIPAKAGIHLLIVLSCLGLFLALTGSAPLAHTDDGETLSIRGKVVNGTDGFTAPAGLVVLMLITGPDGTLTGTGQAPVIYTDDGPDGSFAFDDVERVAGGAYTLSVDYDSVFYGLTLTSEDLDGEQVITIYEPTEDAQIMVVDRQVMVITGFDVSQRVATATEFVRFTNPTDRTLKPNLETARPGMFSFMRFALPPDAANVTVQSNLRGGEVISVGTGFALTAAVPPGEHSVDFAYTFPYEGGSVAYRNSLPQGAGIFQILVPDRWEDIEISGLDPRQPIGIQEGVYRAWEGRNIPAPSPDNAGGVELEFDGLPQPGVLARTGGVLSGGSFWLAAIPSAMGAALLALLVVGLARRFRPPIAYDAGLGLAPAATPSPQRAAIVSALAKLDESYQEGELDEADYLSQRDELVARALGEPSYADREGDEDKDTENDVSNGDGESGGRRD